VPPDGTATLDLGGFLDRAARRLARVGIAGPRREAVRLAADLLEATPAEVVLRARTVLDEGLLDSLERAVVRRAAGEPAAYVTGIAGFRRLVLAVDRQVLIPRPETEGLVDRALEACGTGVAADVGTGSGCVALSLAQEGGYRAVIAIDRSRPALQVARRNRERTRLAVRILAGDLTEPLADASLDVLVSNPPYVSESEWRDLDPGVRSFEPREALVGGPDGTEATRRLLDRGRRVVRPGGAIVLELASLRARQAAEIARDLDWTDVRIDDDLFGRARYLLARRRKTP
jgi:release factor glutamine methyltransferase